MANTKIIPVRTINQMGQKNIMQIDVAIRQTSDSVIQHMTYDVRGMSTVRINISQTMSHKSKIQCELKLSDWKKIQNLIKLIKHHESTTLCDYTWNKYDNIKRTATAVYCAIQIQSRYGLTFEEQDACAKLMSYDLCHIPSHIADRVARYKDRLAAVQKELDTSAITKIPAITINAGSSNFAIFFNPLHLQNERSAPWEIRLATRTENDKPRKGLTIRLTQEDLFLIFDQVDSAIRCAM